MSKQTVFKKVMVTDRLPNKRTYVATINTFITKEQAIQYLDKWKSYRAIGAKSVGL